jgi:AAA family ATP:ADP antiporter
MLSSFIHRFYPDLSKQETRKFALLSCIAFLIIGTYWLLRILKTTIFFKIAFPECVGWCPNQGRLLQPIAKFWSVFVVIGLVLVYSKLVDLFKKHQLFYIICGFYTAIFGCITGILFLSELYGAEFVGKVPLAAAGWLSYFAIESFGSLVVALFWSFTSSITTTESAKHGYPLIISCMQTGAIIGSAIMLFTPHIGTVWPIMGCAALTVCAVIPAVAYFMRTIPASEMIGNKQAEKTEHKKDGFLWGFVSGFIILLTRPYMMGIFIVSTFYEVIGQVLEYQMKSFADTIFPTAAAYGQFEAVFGVTSNVASFLISFLGTSYIIKHYGIRLSLFVYPLITALILGGIFSIFYFFMPEPAMLLWVIFGGYALIKGLGYAVNNPIKEILYIPTSKDVKFKAKGWTDMFGSRFSKGAGAQITNAFKHNLSDLMMFGTMISTGLIGVWMVAALYVGFKNEKLIKENKIVE